jgi:acetyl-CoA acetyltransferase
MWHFSLRMISNDQVHWYPSSAVRSIKEVCMAKRRKLGQGVVAVGAGMSRFGMFPDRDSKDLFPEVFRNLVKSIDKGFDPKHIDALYVGNFASDLFVHQAHWGPIVSDLIDHVPESSTRIKGACASSALAFHEGVFAIASGLSGFYDTVLVGGVEEMSKRATEGVAEGLALPTVPYEGKAAFTFPGVFGAVATAHFSSMPPVGNT